MTRVSCEFEDAMQRGAVPSVSADANFAKDRFPSYKIGAHNAIIELEEDPKVPSLREIVARETILLLEQQKRLSVRDLAKRFEKGLDVASKLSDEGRWKEVTSLDRHVLLKKLRDLLESLRGRVAGQNHDDCKEALSIVEALAVQLTQREGELLQEKSEVKRLANFLKQATEDADKVIEEERAIALAEIEKAKEMVRRVEQALEKNETISRDSEKQVMESSSTCIAQESSVWTLFNSLFNFKTEIYPFQLLAELEGLHPAAGTDMFGWDEGEFSVAAAYRRLSAGDPGVELDLVRDCRQMWKAACLLKVKISAWLLRRRRLVTKVWRARWAPGVCKVCSLCGGGEEDVDHLFFVCPFVVQVWDRMGERWWECRLFEEFWRSFRSGGGGGGRFVFRSKKELAKPLAVLWGIWLGRNAVIFRGQRPYVENFVESIDSLLSLWVVSV